MYLYLPIRTEKMNKPENPIEKLDEILQIDQPQVV
jgi:hypothetical protein